MMEFIFKDTSFFSSIILSSILLTITALFIRRKKGIFTRAEVNLLLLCFCLLAIRLFLPVEISIGHSFYISHFYAKLWDFLRIKLWKNLTIAKTFYISSIFISIFLLFRKFKEHRRFLGLLQDAEQIKELKIQNHFGKTILIPVFQSVYATEPFLIGLQKPKIILPFHSVGTEKYILAHELEHYKNHDLYYKWIFEILSIFYWWNPLIYLLKKYLGNMLELHNDFATTNQFSQEEKIKYTETLIHAAKTKTKLQFGLGLTSNQNFLKCRIYSLFNEDKKGKTFIFLLFLLFLTFGSFFCIIEPTSFPNMQFLEEENLFIPELSYAVKTEQGYDIYMNEKFINSVSEIPEALKPLLKIVTEKEKKK